jgi:hypothetical protein
MHGILMIAAFAVAMAVVNRVLRRMEQDGEFDERSPSSSTPGTRLLMDMRPEGFGGDGIRQRPTA